MGLHIVAVVGGPRVPPCIPSYVSKEMSSVPYPLSYVDIVCANAFRGVLVKVMNTLLRKLEEVQNPLHCDGFGVEIDHNSSPRPDNEEEKGERHDEDGK